MKKRPILFNSEMVRAILEGRKTETRRVIKDQPNYNLKYGQTHKDLEKNILRRCPYGQVGDWLWVRETFFEEYNPITAKQYDPARYIYRATNTEEVLQMDEDGFTKTNKDGSMASPWKPSIFMLREASRITLEITEIKVERVQDITEEGAIAEGTISTAELTESRDDYYGLYASEHFQDLWNSIYKNWDDNPWVWVITFKRVD